MIIWKHDGKTMIWEDGRWVEQAPWEWDEHDLANMAGGQGDESWPPKEATP